MTVQDRGRRRHRSAGVPQSGAMDWLALAAANSSVANRTDAAAIECALGGLILRFDAAMSFAIGGARVEASLSGIPVVNDCLIRAKRGDELKVNAILSGRFYYLALAGGVDVPEILGSRSTYLPGAFGGFNGRRIQAGDTLPVLVPEKPGQASAQKRFLTNPESRGLVRVLRGDQSALFSAELWRTFLESPFRVTTASDRTGYRLAGPDLSHDFAELPSEGACPGAVQLPPDGQPIVLMADAPTVGGYPKIAVVITADLPALAQCVPGETVSFAETTTEEAEAALRALTGHYD